MAKKNFCFINLMFWYTHSKVFNGTSLVFFINFGLYNTSGDFLCDFLPRLRWLFVSGERGIVGHRRRRCIQCEETSLAVKAGTHSLCSGGPPRAAAASSALVTSQFVSTDGKWLVMNEKTKCRMIFIHCIAFLCLFFNKLNHSHVPFYDKEKLIIFYYK